MISLFSLFIRGVTVFWLYLSLVISVYSFVLASSSCKTTFVWQKMAKTGGKKPKGKAANAEIESADAVLKNFSDSHQMSVDESTTEKRKRKEKIRTSHSGKDLKHLQVNEKQPKHSQQINDDQKSKKSHLSLDAVCVEDMPQLGSQSEKKSKKRKHDHAASTNKSVLPSLQNSEKKNKKIKLAVETSAKVDVDIADKRKRFDKVGSLSDAESAKNVFHSSTEVDKTNKSKKEKSVKGKNKRKLAEQQEIKGDEENISETKQTDSTAKFHALEYLRRWKQCRSEWSFQKVRQVWLLQNMYDEKQVQHV
jgi:WKF domain